MLKLIHKKNNKGELFMKRLYHNIILQKKLPKKINTNTWHMKEEVEKRTTNL